jgi:hypothetical protein
MGEKGEANNIGDEETTISPGMRIGFKGFEGWRVEGEGEEEGNEEEEGEEGEEEESEEEMMVDET